MRIAIDCRTILNPEKGEAGGIGHYVYQLVRHLLKIDQKNEYTLLFDDRLKTKKLKKFVRKNVKFSFYPFYLYSKFILPSISRYLFEATVKKENFDLLHLPYVPEISKKPDLKTVVTVHDLSVLRIPNCFSNKACEFEMKKFSNILPQADKIIAVSESTKNDISEIFKISKEKIRVIYHGLDERFLKQVSIKEIEEVKIKYKIKNNYLLFLSPLETRKNICRLIRAFDVLKEEIKNNPKKFSSILKDDKNIQLVLAGKEGSAIGKIRNIVKNSLYQRDIILTGYVDPDDLNALFAGAKIFVFPSLYEGFGLPLIEAMAHQIPIITSNISSLLEIVGDGNAVFINPYSTKEIAEAMIKLLSDNKLRNKITEKSIARAKEYQWERTARETLKTYEEVSK